MAVSARDELARLLGGEPSRPTHGRVAADDVRLNVSVDGVGPLSQPVTRAQARKLCALGTPAPYGRGEETLTDESVRHTWRIPDELVRVDWGDALDDVLDSARAVLGLAVGTRLAAEFHSMLVYEPGHLFVPHQDSEKHDDMAASLVVILPSAHTGGELVVHDGRRETAYRGSRDATTIVVLYADQVHEVRPVRSGFRIALTFNLLAQQSDTAAMPRDLVGQAAVLVRRHFEEPPKPHWPGDKEDPPPRLAYLLDHQYTARSLSWSRLKGGDIHRAAALRVSGDIADCEVLLALADIHETWDAEVSDDYGRPSWEQEDAAEGDEYGEDAQPGSLIESEISLTHWLASGAETPERMDLSLDSWEVCATTPTVELRPYQSEFEGYMGNYGNTLDRWYHRAAVVLWPRRLAFANRAEAAPQWALEDVLSRLVDGPAQGVLADLAEVKPFWSGVVRTTSQNSLLEQALTVAHRIDEPELARMLLDPFRIESLGPDLVADLVPLTDRYGMGWARQLLPSWFGRRVGLPHWQGLDAWVNTLPEGCTELSARPEIGRELIRLAWAGLAGRLAVALNASTSARVREQLAALGAPVAAVLHATAVVDDPGVREEIIAACTAGEAPLATVLPLLREAEAWPQGIRGTAGGERLAAYAIGLLRQRVARPERAPDDWAIALPKGCDCELCARLAGFLADPKQRVHEWPLAQHGRGHVHARIDAAELAVTHRTRRSGRPYTLVLTKTDQLFEREADARRDDEAALSRLEQAWG